MDTARQGALQKRELHVQPETTAIPVLINEADHQHPQGKSTDGTCTICRCKVLELRNKTQKGKADPAKNGTDHDLLSIIEKEDWDLREMQFPWSCWLGLTPDPS